MPLTSAYRPAPLASVVQFVTVIGDASLRPRCWSDAGTDRAFARNLSAVKPRVPPAWSAERPEERAYVADQEVGCFHRGEVAAAVEFGPVHDVVGLLGETPDRRCDLPWEDRNAGGHGRGRRGTPVAGAADLVVEARRRSCRPGQPVQHDVGEEQVPVNGAGQSRVGPLIELLHDPGQLARR